MRPQAVLFDVGETLLWLDEEAIAQAVGVSAAQVLPAMVAIRRQVDVALTAAAPGASSPAASPDPIVLLLQALDVPLEERAAAGAALHALDRREALWCRVPPDAATALAQLESQGLRLAAVSNSDGTAEAKLTQAGLRAPFEFVLDSHLEGVEKPDPELFRRAVARLGLPPASVVYVGDVYAIDVLGARSAGLIGVLLDRSGTYPNPCPTVASLGELPSLLAGMD